MTELKVCVKSKGQRQLEVGAFIRSDDDATAQEKAYAGALLEGLKMVMEVMMQMEAESATLVTSEDPTGEMRRRVKERLNWKED